MKMTKQKPAKKLQSFDFERYERDGTSGLSKQAFNKNEKHLRTKLGGMYERGSLQWIEPSFGSTLGLPDVNLPTSSGRIPVELKWWKGKKAPVAKMRPVQIQYHIMSAHRGERTAILFVWESPIKDSKHPRTCTLYLLNGKHCPKAPDQLDLSKAYIVGDEYGITEELKASLDNIINSEAFWK